jgi:hypothetical protein
MADAFTSGLSAVEPLSVANAAGMLGIGGKQPEDNSARADQNGSDDAPRDNDEPTVDNDTAQDASPGEDDEDTAAAGDDQPPGDEETGKDDPAGDDQPSVEPPRSWTKAEKEAFAALPRQHQETLIARERARELDIRKRQNDVVTAYRAVEAEKQATEQARSQYEQGIKQLAEQANTFLANEFSDIKSWDDVHKMAAEDPVRHNRWQAARAQAEAIQREQARLAEETRQKQTEAFQSYERQQTQAFIEAAPEFADPKQGPQLAAEINAMLVSDYGVPEQELAALWAGAQISALDHRFRLLMRDALAYKKMKAVKPSPRPAPKPAAPPPQRPGTPPASGEVANRRLEKANDELTRTGSRNAALALMRARRA